MASINELGAVTHPGLNETVAVDADAKDDSDEEEMFAEESPAINKDFDDESTTIFGDLSVDFELLKRIPCPYTDIITEFADVEIFMISIDSLLLELSAHAYHNWMLGGQTIVLAEQIDKFLNALDELNAKFILVWFSDLKPYFAKDQFLQFLHSFVLAHLSKSKWADAIECFKNPLDPNWSNFLHRLTPSFLLVSLENASKTFVSENIDFASRFLSITIQLITFAIPVVYFNGFTINFSTVMAYRLSTIPLSITDLDVKIGNFWQEKFVKPELSSDEANAIYNCDSLTKFWATIMKNEIVRNGTSDEFEEFCIAVLISVLSCQKLGVLRNYSFEDKESLIKGPPMKANNGRRRLFAAVTRILEAIDLTKLKYAVADLWDGRHILGIYRQVIAKAEILPFRLQEEFAKLHTFIGLKVSVPTDPQDKLLDPLSPSSPTKVAEKLLIEKLKLYSVKNQLVNEFIPESEELLSKYDCIDESNVETKCDQPQFSRWKFVPVPDRLLQLERENANKPVEQWRIKRMNRERQKLSRWYQNFADSLEGRGNDLLVDFSRTPRLPTTQEEENNANGVNTSKKGHGGKGNSGGGKKGSKGKEPQLSKKEQILRANRGAMDKKQIESDKMKIAFATQVKAQAITALEEVFRKLELQESKALCIFEKAIRCAEIFADKIPTFKTLEQKRDGALDLVETLKKCSINFWSHLDENQKEKIRGLWISLGFVQSTSKRHTDRTFALEMNMVEYQLYHGGRLIDILSDPRKDDRVVGFNPDGWQRKMLDVVDQNKSALIVAPTSAGKTFVSYYCIEKVLRKSNEDVVVYISPAKALMNQVVGSVYARFKNKPMVGSRVLYGTFTMEYSDNCLNCQVLVTIPECLEVMLLSTDPVVQQFVSRIKYVILDEVHSINASNQGHIWEHIFLLIRCPFLALSATISNVDAVQNWLQTAEKIKALKGEEPRTIELITYDERWSELELAIARMSEADSDENFAKELEMFYRGGSVQSMTVKSKDDDTGRSTPDSQQNWQTPTELRLQLLNDLILAFHPYGIYKPEKLRMFGIPVDQRLTSRQIVELYSIMSEIDDNVKVEFEPCKFFGYKCGDETFSWLTRVMLRDYETRLRSRFMSWLKNDTQKINKVFSLLDANVHDELEKRSKPFNMRNAVLHNIVPLLDDLKRTDRLPALCFNDDRNICESLAVRVFSEMQNREFAYRSSDEFKRKFNTKAEEKAEKIAKRKRDAQLREKKRKTAKKRGDEDDDNGDDAGEWDNIDDQPTDQFLLVKIKLEEELKKFKFYGRWSDEDVYNKTIDRLVERNGNRPSTQRLIRLFQRGIGFHHDGLTAPERGAVEILFRAGFLGIVFSTSTLALGMNMPCKTVVFGIDTPMLTPLQFRQMSGRAGRRGFDSAGTVIFMALPTSKIRRLLTSSLATLRGNVPYTTSFLLKIFGYVKGSQLSLLTIRDDESGTVATPTAATSVVNRKSKPQTAETTDVTLASVRRTAALSLLRAPFALHTRNENGLGTLECVLKYLTFFNIQLLRKHQLLNDKCEMVNFAFMAVHLSNFEPGNLVFTIILQSGVLHQLYRDMEKAQFKDVLINILAHIFTNCFIPIYSYDENVDVGNFVDEPVLKPMPQMVEEIVGTYNQSVEELLLACLQLASPTLQLENSVLRLSGKCDSLTIYNMDVVPIFDHDLVLDDSFVPTICLQHCDHRGRKIYRNSYAYDFWKRGDRKSLISYNKLLIGEIWYMINAFTKTLSAISVALETMAKSTDPINIIFAEVAAEYEMKFKRGFDMVKRNDDKE